MFARPDKVGHTVYMHNEATYQATLDKLYFDLLPDERKEETSEVEYWPEAPRY